MVLKKKFVSFYVKFPFDVFMSLMFLALLFLFMYFTFFIPCNEKFVCLANGFIELGIFKRNIIPIFVIVINSILYVYALGYILLRKRIRGIEKGKYEDDVKRAYEKIMSKEEDV